MLQRLHERYAASGSVAIVGVTDDHPARVRSFMEQAGMSYPVLWDGEAQLRRPWKVNTIPFHVFVDAEGKIAGDVTGAIDEDEALSRLRTLGAKE